MWLFLLIENYEIEIYENKKKKKSTKRKREQNEENNEIDYKQKCDFLF